MPPPTPARRRACRPRPPAAPPRERRPRFAQGAPPRRAEALEARELRLRRHAGRAGALDQLAASAATASAARSAASSPDCPRPPSAGRSAAGSGSRPRQIWLRRSSTSAASRSAKGARPSALDPRLQPGPGRESRHAASGDRDPLAGARVDALARSALGDMKLAEAGEVDVLTACQRVRDRVEHRLDGLGRPASCCPRGRRGRVGQRTQLSSHSTSVARAGRQI